MLLPLTFSPPQQAARAASWEAKFTDRQMSVNLSLSLIFRSEIMPSPLFAPMVALILWTLAMCAWLYATRIPAIRHNRIVYDPARPAEEFHAQLPAEVRWKADNYNNLLEQPTLFYAVTLVLALLGADSGLNIGLAWLYVALRVVHSLVQATINVVILRFAVFMAATIVLLAMTIRAALIVF
jgi:hypothetical protein